MSATEPAKGGSGFVEAEAVVPTYKMLQEVAAEATTEVEDPLKMEHY